MVWAQLRRLMVDGSKDGLENKLPPHCLSHHPETGRTVIIIRGRMGFAPYSGQESPDSYNHRHRFTYEMIEAMEYGALLGFDAPLADPDQVRSVRKDLGLPIGPVASPARSTPAAPSAWDVRPASRPAAVKREPELKFLPEFGG